MLHRVQAGFDTSVIDEALAILPPGLASMLLAETHLFLGADPIFSGLHAGFSEAARSAFGYTGPVAYGSVAHCCYPWHVDVRVEHPVIVIPLDCPPSTIVHELGHVLDWLTGFEIEFEPCTAYAQINRMEAFAEAFESWFIPPNWDRAETRIREYIGRDGCAQMEAIVRAPN